MKKNLLILPLIALLFTASLGLGCQSQKRAGYVAAGSVTTTVDTAIGAFNDYRKTHPVPVETVLQVRNAALAYKDAVAIAEAVERSFRTGTATQDQVDNALNAIESASANVFSLIAQFIPQQPKK